MPGHSLKCYHCLFMSPKCRPWDVPRGGIINDLAKHDHNLIEYLFVVKSGIK